VSFTRLRNLILRHRTSITGLSLIFIGTLVALYFVYEVDVFQQEGVPTRAETIELDEALLVSALLILSLLTFGTFQYLAQKREVVRRIAAERHARELAYQDGLTGLPNRRRYDEALQTALASPPRAGASHGVLLLDLNGFKQINDVHGHGVGDEVLIIVAHRLCSAMRDGDMVARFGGDEFAILATHLAGPEAATNVALRIIEALSTPVRAGRAAHCVNVGIGIALVPTDAADADTALRKADVALYRAKAERRSALRFFEPEMDVRVQERATMEVGLREAMDNGRIETVFQPTINLRSQKVIGFEASPRWIDPEQGPIAPERFIAIAEEVGIIHALADRVLRQACEAARKWPSHVTFSLDIYPSQLEDRLLPARILRVLQDNELAPQRLELEITESALVADMDNAQVVLGALRNAGVRVALDNFGTGYSSLYHLRNLKVDKLKIDRSFIAAMQSEKASAEIVDALVGLGHGLGLTIVADGIEASDQEARVLRTGCDEGQGRHFGAALLAIETEKLFHTGAPTPVRHTGG
jgi:diguanylate cyclase (GGDEF)-like protein